MNIGNLVSLPFSFRSIHERGIRGASFVSRRRLRSSSNVTFAETAACVHSPTTSFDASSPVGFGPDARFALQSPPQSTPQVRNGSTSNRVLVYIFTNLLCNLCFKLSRSHLICVIIINPVSIILRFDIQYVSSPQSRCFVKHF